MSRESRQRPDRSRSPQQRQQPEARRNDRHSLSDRVSGISTETRSRMERTTTAPINELDLSKSGAANPTNSVSLNRVTISFNDGGGRNNSWRPGGRAAPPYNNDHSQLGRRREFPDRQDRFHQSRQRQPMTWERQNTSRPSSDPSQSSASVDDAKPVMRLIDPQSVPRHRLYFDHDDRSGGGNGRTFSRRSAMYDPREESSRNDGRRRNFNYDRSESRSGGLWKHDKWEELQHESAGNDGKSRDASNAKTSTGHVADLLD